MSRHVKEVKNGYGTTLFINDNDYISVCKDGKNVMIRSSNTVFGFNSWADIEAAIDPSKAAWFDVDQNNKNNKQ